MRRKYGVVDVVDESKMRLRFGQIKGAVKGTKLWAGDRVGSELRGAAPSRTIRTGQPHYPSSRKVMHVDAAVGPLWSIASV
jgi:hypothetical protein